MADDDEGLYDELYGDDDDEVPMAPPQIVPPEEPAPEEPTPAPEEPTPVAANAPGDGDGGDDDDSDDDFDIALNEPEERGSDEEPDEFMIQLDDTEQKQQLYQQQYGAEEEDAGAGDELDAQLDGMPGAAPDDPAAAAHAQSDPIHYRSKTYVRGSVPPPAPPPGAPSDPPPLAPAVRRPPRRPRPPLLRGRFDARGGTPGHRARVGSHRIGSNRSAAAAAPPPGAPSVPRYVGPAVRPPPPLQMEDGTWNTYNRQPPNARYNEKGQRMMPGGEGGSRFIPPEEYKEFLQLGHGGIFDVDLDNIDVAPWRKPGADVSAFFNFGLNEHTWRQYASDVRHARLELALQEKIQTVGDDDDYDVAYPHGPPPEVPMQRAMDGGGSFGGPPGPGGGFAPPPPAGPPPPDQPMGRGGFPAGSPMGPPPPTAPGFEFGGPGAGGLPGPSMLAPKDMPRWMRATMGVALEDAPAEEIEEEITEEVTDDEEEYGLVLAGDDGDDETAADEDDNAPKEKKKKTVTRTVKKGRGEVRGGARRHRGGAGAARERPDRGDGHRPGFRLQG